MKVKAKKLGFYGGQRRREGAEFDIKDESDLGAWMEVIGKPEEEPEKPEQSPGEDKPAFDYKAEAKRLGIPMEVDGKKVHHHTLRKQVEDALAQEKGE